MLITTETAAELHVTYCLNVHRGESWTENLAAIDTHARRVRDLLGIETMFGLGLRLGQRAASELKQPANLAAFKAYLQQHRLYVFTINGFPYGQFHDTNIKDRVYAPDWQQAARLDYTCDLIDILAALLPAGCSGSISTVPGSYRLWSDSAAALTPILANLALAAQHCQAVEHATGRYIRLALEPEPDCLWDQTSQLVELFSTVLPDRGAEIAAARLGCSCSQAQQLFQNYLGVCFDTCHQAVCFEDVAASLQSLRDHNIAIAKIHVSAAPVAACTPAALADMVEFVDPVYLHQSCIRTADGKLHRYPDLPPALVAAANAGSGAELRTHFHIPLAIARWRQLGSTRSELDQHFFALLRAGICTHLELETYTFAVLPEELQQQGVDASLAAELQWFLQHLRT